MLAIIMPFTYTRNYCYMHIIISLYVMIKLLNMAYNSSKWIERKYYEVF